ncbi:DNA-processing protein DprA [Bdellovibrionota bacterium]
MMERDLHWIALNSLREVSPKLALNLVKKFGSPKAIFSSSREALKKVEGITPLAEKAISRFDRYDWAYSELQMAQDLGISLITWGSKDYPKGLSQIYDPPILLYVKGEIRESDHTALAMVGSRKATAYGLRTANQIAASLTKHGVTLVSGMARGVDTEVHRTALKHCGRTIAVLGSGLEFVYPPENRPLFSEIYKNGAVISEFPLLTPPRPYHFPRRNRIISGLTLGTVVVEASERSGSLITARYALEQGREVFAIPGPVGGQNSEGTHRLIQEGAKLVQNLEDIITELRIEKQKAQISNERNNLSELANWILEEIDDEPLSVNHLAERSKHSAQSLSAAMTELELNGFVKQIHGNRYLKEA